MDFYRAVSECDPAKENMTAVILNGPGLGKRAVFTDNELVWEEEEGGFFTHNQAELMDALHHSPAGAKGLAKLQGTQVFCDRLGQEMHLVICGGGHVSIPVIKIGVMMGCKVTVLEDRPLFADNARRAGASEVLCDSFEHGLSQIQGGDNTYFVIVTRGHRYDQVCLEKIVRKSHAYIGMIGSRRRVAAVKEAILEGGGDPKVLEGLYSPIGLDIGAETPEEIGVAIMAEIIEVKNKKRRTGGYSKEMLREIMKPAGDVGTKMLVLPDGKCVGTTGGGCMEADVARRALHMIRDGSEERKLCHVDMTGAEAEDEGMVCGGIVDVLLEVISF